MLSGDTLPPGLDGACLAGLKSEYPVDSSREPQTARICLSSLATTKTAKNPEAAGHRVLLTFYAARVQQ